MTTTAVLLMAYGSPDRLEDVGPYLRHIRGGRISPGEAIEHLRERYASIGGRTPLLDTTLATGKALQRRLDARGGERYRVYCAMKHWHPYIGDVVRRMLADGVRRAIAIVLAPHYSTMSVEGYRHAVEEALRSETEFELTFVKQWHMEPGFIELLADRVRRGLEGIADVPPDDVAVVFSAHSLPARIREMKDPYERQLQESCQAVALRAGLRRWHWAWQSASDTGEPWLTPDIRDYLDELHAAGVKHVLSVPIGFVCDHLEVLYDIDREAKEHAVSLGMTLDRIAMPNADPELVEVLAAVVGRAEQEHATRLAVL